jgi:hypothetical protein
VAQSGTKVGKHLPHYHHYFKESTNTSIEMSARNLKGQDTIVVINPKESAPKEIQMTERWTVAQMQKEFHGMQVFARNKNLHKMPPRNKGGIVWLPKFKVIAVVLESMGPYGFVKQLYPPQKKGEKPKYLEIDMRQDGVYLEQLYGLPIVEEYNRKLRHKAVDRNTGFVVPLVDDAGNLKMNVEGSDIAYMGQDKQVPEHIMKDWPKKDPWTVFEEDSCRDPPDKKLYQNGVPVVYIYHRNRRKYKECMVYHTYNSKNEKVMKQLISVPLGPPEPCDSLR